MSLLGCAPISTESKDPAPPAAAASLNTSMAWVSMREGLVQLDNGTRGAEIIGVVVSRDTEPPAYAGVKDLPGFYTRKTKADGTPRTVYLSMTDKMTAAKFNANVTISVDGGATGFVSAINSAPELLHPNTQYYVHFYEVSSTAGTAIEKLEFTTEDFPSSYPTARGTYSRFYNQITAGSASPNMEYKGTESYLIPLRFHYRTSGGPYAFTPGALAPVELVESSPNMRPFGITITPTLFYDLYNITSSGPDINVVLWDGMIKLRDFRSLALDQSFGSIDDLNHFIVYDNKKTVLVTE
ncbi:hypothetical protein P0082_05940 [Candidatus Haliotispira prima]|uniref:DUF4249 family protein n=1 Tax=Candidatus Haliotispira prima TaxID=3034016 RepID=A0ABY8MK92_9SPIO|nr:hypothetical protein P0082_05940 [Candidatus Haliotispira prima]